MILSDTSIGNRILTGSIIINPFDVNLIQPASLDIRLGNVFKHTWDDFATIDVLSPEHMAPLLADYVKLGDSFVINPGQAVLASTFEYVEIPPDLIATVCGKSSVARLFLRVHVTAGHIDPGFKGFITLELVNDNKVPIKLYPGMRIGQLVFEQLDQVAMHPYGSEKLGSRYQNQLQATTSRYIQ